MQPYLPTVTVGLLLILARPAATLSTTSNPCPAADIAAVDLCFNAFKQPYDAYVNAPSNTTKNALCTAFHAFRICMKDIDNTVCAQSIDGAGASRNMNVTLVTELCPDVLPDPSGGPTVACDIQPIKTCMTFKPEYDAYQADKTDPAKQAAFCAQFTAATKSACLEPYRSCHNQIGDALTQLGIDRTELIMCTTGTAPSPAQQNCTSKTEKDCASYLNPSAPDCRGFKTCVTPKVMECGLNDRQLSLLVYSLDAGCKVQECASGKLNNCSARFVNDETGDFKCKDFATCATKKLPECSATFYTSEVTKHLVDQEKAGCLKIKDCVARASQKCEEQITKTQTDPCETLKACQKRALEKCGLVKGDVSKLITKSAAEAEVCEPGSADPTIVINEILLFATLGLLLSRFVV